MGVVRGVARPKPAKDKLAHKPRPLRKSIAATNAAAAAVAAGGSGGLASQRGEEVDAAGGTPKGDMCANHSLWSSKFLICCSDRQPKLL